MAYRRKQGITRAATFKDEIIHRPGISDEDDDDEDNKEFSPSSLAAQAIRASAAHRDSSLSSAYEDSAFYINNNPSRSMNFNPPETTSISNESNSGFWGVLARKAKAILDDDNGNGNSLSSGSSRFQMRDSGNQLHKTYQPSDNVRRLENPRFRKGLDAITTSLNQIGDTFEKAFVGGKTIVENKTADIIQETRKLQIRRKGGNSETHDQISGAHAMWQPVQHTQSPIQTTQETQLKASRDVAMATAAKAKLLLRELKTIKADLAFAKERCTQLEEENKMLRASRAKSNNPADDDMIRLQLETLLAEKARLAHENSVYARENRFLREIVEYHQLTMQDVVYIDEGIEEVTEVYPIPGVARMLSVSPPISPHSPSSASPSAISPTVTKHVTETIPNASNPLRGDKDSTKEQEGAQHIDSSVSVTEESARSSISSS